MYLFFSSLLIPLSLSRWSRPSQVNGVLEFYSIFLSHGGSEPVLAYNSSGLFEDHTLRNLTPGTAYTITLAVSPLLFHVFDFHCHFQPYINVFVCMSGLHRRWMYPKPPQPGSNWGEHPRKCSCTAGHCFVPQCTQRQLDTSWYSKWWEDTSLFFTPRTPKLTRIRP